MDGATGGPGGFTEENLDGLSSTFGRRLPHNTEAEMAVLGAMLVNPRAAGRVLQHLDDPAAFALIEHRQIFDCLRKLHLRGKPTDCVSAKSYLPAGISHDYIGELVDCAVTLSNAAEYSRQLRELWLRRQWIAVGDEIAQGAYDLDQETLVPPESLEQVDALRWQRSGGVEGIEKYRFSQIHLVQSPPVEPLLGGWLHRQSRAFISGADKTGKSYFALEIMRAVSTGADLLHWKGTGKRRSVLYVDGEMGIEEVKRRQADFVKRYGDVGDAYFLHFDCYPIPPIDTIAGHQMILNVAEQVKAELVIIDNYTALTDETLNDDTTLKAIRPLINELMARRIGSVSIAHAGHANQERPAGSYVTKALTTGILSLTKDDASSTQDGCFGMATWTSVRAARPNDPDYRAFPYALVDGALVEAEGGGGRGKLPEKQALRWALGQLSQCLHNRGQVLCGNAVRPNGMSAVETRTFREWLMRRGETTEIECQRVIKDLIVGGWICKDGDWIWRV